MLPEWLIHLHVFLTCRMQEDTWQFLQCEAWCQNILPCELELSTVISWSILLSKINNKKHLFEKKIYFTKETFRCPVTFHLKMMMSALGGTQPKCLSFYISINTTQTITFCEIQNFPIYQLSPYQNLTNKIVRRNQICLLKIMVTIVWNLPFFLFYK